MQYSVKQPFFAVLLFHFQRLFSPVFFSCFLLLRAFFFVFVCLLGKETCFLLHDVFASNDVELKKNLAHNCNAFITVALFGPLFCWGFDSRLRNRWNDCRRCVCIDGTRRKSAVIALRTHVCVRVSSLHCYMCALLYFVWAHWLETIHIPHFGDSPTSMGANGFSKMETLLAHDLWKNCLIVGTAFVHGKWWIGAIG